jgi:hypothetical protein
VIFYAELGQTGLAGTAGVTVYYGDVELVPRTTVGLSPIGDTTVYAVDVDDQELDGEYVALVDDGTALVWFEPFTVGELGVQTTGVLEEVCA